MPEATIAQRIVRAKRTLAEASAVRGARPATSWRARLAAVLEVVYLIFNEGYAATAGDDWMRPALCEDALRLGRVLAGAGAARARGPRPGGADGDPGVAAARRASARDGAPVLLLDQDRARWDRLLIRRGLAALSAPRRSAALRPVRAAGRDRRLPRAGARPPQDTDWMRIAALYDALAAARRPRRSSSSTARSRSAMAFGPAAGLEHRRRARATSRRSPATTCCRACAATCSRGSAARDEARAEFAARRRA